MSKGQLKHPPHILLDDTWYMITSSTYQRHRLLAKEGHKDFLRDQIKGMVTKFDLKLAAWVILDNHYHVLIKSKLGVMLPKALGQLHGRVSFELVQVRIGVEALAGGSHENSSQLDQLNV